MRAAGIIFLCLQATIFYAVSAQQSPFLRNGNPFGNSLAGQTTGNSDFGLENGFSGNSINEISSNNNIVSSNFGGLSNNEISSSNNIFSSNFGSGNSVNDISSNNNIFSSNIGGNSLNEISSTNNVQSNNFGGFSGNEISSLNNIRSSNFGNGIGGFPGNSGNSFLPSNGFTNFGLELSGQNIGSFPNNGNSNNFGGFSNLGANANSFASANSYSNANNLANTNNCGPKLLNNFACPAQNCQNNEFIAPPKVTGSSLNLALPDNFLGTMPCLGNTDALLATLQSGKGFQPIISEIVPNLQVGDINLSGDLPVGGTIKVCGCFPVFGIIGVEGTMPSSGTAVVSSGFSGSALEPGCGCHS